MQPFKRVIIDYLYSGGARITWEFSDHFKDVGPYIFQLQGSEAAGIPTADDWINIGSATVDVAFLVDPSKTQYGKTNILAYRIKLTTPENIYFSDPAEPLGKFTKFDWLISREIIRKEQLNHRLFSSVKGFLLKARRYGTPCDSVDQFTGEVTDSNCTDCYGTGFLGGFFDPVPATFALVDPSQAREHRDLQATGTQKQQVTKGRFIGTPEVIQGDVFVVDGSDERYYIHTVKELATWKTVPLIVEVELRLAPFSDIIYKVPVLETA